VWTKGSKKKRGEEEREALQRKERKPKGGEKVWVDIGEKGGGGVIN